MNYLAEEVVGCHDGDIVRLNGKRYRLEKKTGSAIAVRRWYWFDDVVAWLGRRFGAD